MNDITDKRINDLYQAMKDQFEFDIRTYFNEDLEISDIMKKTFSVISNEAIDDKVTLDVIIEELADYYMMAAMYALAFSKKESISNTLLGSAAYYSYFLLDALNCPNTKGFSPIVLMEKAGKLWSVLFLSKRYDDAMKVGEDFINSINGDHASIIRYGSRLYPEVWFLIDLYSLSTGKLYDKKRADYPDDMSPYTEILDEWDTQDLKKVDHFVNLLGEVHLLSDEDEEDESDEQYLAFHHPLMKLYPYEAIVYLAIREKQGLKNPDEYSHPLMNTPIAKKFFEQKEPLGKPKDLPYAKGLMAKLKEKCPAIELPDWMG